MFDAFNSTLNALLTSASTEQKSKMTGRKRSRGTQRFAGSFSARSYWEHSNEMSIGWMPWKGSRNTKSGRYLPFFDATYWRFISFIALANVNTTCCLLTSSVMYSFLFNTCRAKTSTDFERADVVQSESCAQWLNHPCYGRSLHALGKENVPARQFTTRLPGRGNLLIISFIHNMFFGPSRDSIFETEFAGISPEDASIMQCTRDFWHQSCPPQICQF